MRFVIFFLALGFLGSKSLVAADELSKKIEVIPMPVNGIGSAHHKLLLRFPEQNHSLYGSDLIVQIPMLKEPESSDSDEGTEENFFARHDSIWREPIPAGLWKNVAMKTSGSSSDARLFKFDPMLDGQVFHFVYRYNLNQFLNSDDAFLPTDGEVYGSKSIAQQIPVEPLSEKNLKYLEAYNNRDIFKKRPAELSERNIYEYRALKHMIHDISIRTYRQRFVVMVGTKSCVHCKVQADAMQKLANEGVGRKEYETVFIKLILPHKDLLKLVDEWELADTIPQTLVFQNAIRIAGPYTTGLTEDRLKFLATDQLGTN